MILDFAANPTIGSALDLDEIRPELFAGSPDLLVALAADLQLRGGFERGRRALALARKAGIDPAQQPELAVQLASVNAIDFGSYRSAARVTGPAAVGAKLGGWRRCRGRVAPRPRHLGRLLPHLSR